MFTATPVALVPRLRIAECSRQEAQPLLELHYASGPPARVCRILGAWLGVEHAEELVGVLAVSYPTLNGRWRTIAWPGDYTGASKRASAQNLNAEVRRISRVVVAPRHRAQGIATALVRAYLRRPLTIRTETVAAMGRYCACFDRAGMRSISCGKSARDHALAAALRSLRILPETLVDDRAVHKLAMSMPELVRALTRWANAARSTRGLLKQDDALNLIAPAAARSLSVTDRVWVFDSAHAQSPANRISSIAS